MPAGRGVAPVGSLKIVTTKMKPGYLRRNGVPYSANATLTEYFDKIDEPNGDSYLLVTTTVEDPTYLGAIQAFDTKDLPCKVAGQVPAGALLRR